MGLISHLLYSPVEGLGETWTSAFNCALLFYSIFLLDICIVSQLYGFMADVEG